jgi:hypothetical protein
MKRDMMVVGLQMIEDDLVKLELVELTGKVKRSVGVMELVGMSAIEAAKHIKGTTYHRDKIYLPFQYCSKNNIHLTSALEVEINYADVERIKDEYTHKC